MSEKLNSILDDFNRYSSPLVELGRYFKHTGVLTPDEISAIRKVLASNTEIHTNVYEATILPTSDINIELAQKLGIALVNAILEDSGGVVAVRKPGTRDWFDQSEVDEWLVNRRFYKLPSGTYITTCFPELDFKFTETGAVVNPIQGFPNRFLMVTDDMLKERKRYRNGDLVELTEDDVEYLIETLLYIPQGETLQNQLTIGTLYIDSVILSTGSICGVKKESAFGITVFYEAGGQIPLNFTDAVEQHAAWRIFDSIIRVRSVNQLTQKEHFDIELATGSDPRPILNPEDRF